MYKYVLKPFPWYFKFLPISKHGFTSFLSNKIYLSDEVLLDLQNENPKPFSKSVLVHQLVHVNNFGLSKFLKYVFSRKFRIEEERKAYLQMFKVLKNNKETIDLDTISVQLSGVRYLWSFRYKGAQKFITNVWDSA